MTVRLNSRLRGYDGVKRIPTACNGNEVIEEAYSIPVIPAKAGIQWIQA
ncbi:MAG: hypothetical protein WCD07_06470 [Burkholderiales bacterium]